MKTPHEWREERPLAKEAEYAFHRGFLDLPVEGGRRRNGSPLCKCT